MEGARHEGLPQPVSRRFFQRPVAEVAPALLGCYLVRDLGDTTVGGRIVETEGYGGPGDPGSHADRAPSGRARIMFGPAGVVYVYFTYGMHHCMNLVTGTEGEASAVLIRALEPVWGIERMRTGAPATLADHLVASGPGRVCRALGVDRDLNGVDLAAGPLRVLRGRRRRAEDVRRGIRVGLSADDGRRWRFWIPNASVSRVPGSRDRGRRG
ncbi:MAG: DNA-3-methyladenine glycosylase [Actinomycetota bacterium]